MAAPTGTFQTHQQIGIREELGDEIFDITPTDRPFMSNIARRSGANSYFIEWQTD